MTRRVKLGIPDDKNFEHVLHRCFIGQKAQTRLAKAFLEIIRSLCEREEGCTHDHDKELIEVSYVLREMGTFAADDAAKLRELWDAIDDALSDAHTRGEESGASLLKQLAAGKTTIERYNEMTIRGETDDHR